MLHLLFAPIILLVVLALVLLRVITAPFRFRHWRRRHWGYSRPWGYGQYGGRPRMSLVSILALLALDRILSRRHW